MRTRSILACIVISLLFGCKKSDTKERPGSFLSFKMNGTEYRFDIQKFDGENPKGNLFIYSRCQWGTRNGVETNFPYWFDLRKTSDGTICAVLLPKEFLMTNYMDLSKPCQFYVDTVDANGNRLPIEKVFYSQSGTLTYTKSNCGNKSYFDLSCLCMEKADMCDVSGSFTMSFKNGLDETISLNNGQFFMRDAFQ